MKIGIEASAIFRPNKTGISYYCENLITAAANELSGDELKLCYFNFLGRSTVKSRIAGTNVSHRMIWWLPAKIYNALDHYVTPPPFDFVAGTKVNVWLFPNFFRWPLLFSKKSVVIVHDLGYIDVPQYLTPRHRKYLSRKIPQAIKKADKVITISGHTKRQIIKHYGTSPEKIKVITPAVGAKFKPASKQEVETVKEKYGVQGQYLLYLGTIEPRKNISSIIRAYAELPNQTKKEFKLVLAGGKGWLDQEINELATTIPESQLVKTGYLPDKDQVALYSGATLFLYL